MSQVLEQHNGTVNETPSTESWPAWFKALQLEALQEYDATPFPKRTDEAWRFSNLKAVALDAFQEAPSPGLLADYADQSQRLIAQSHRLIFANNALLERQATNLPEGVILESLPTAAQRHQDLFRSYFMAQAVELGSHKFAALHKARLKNGTFLYVPDGVELTVPIEIFHWVRGENASVFPHTLIVCGRNSKVTVIDHFRSFDQSPAFGCCLNDLHVGEGAKLHYVAIQDWSKKTLAFHINSTQVGQEATSTALSVNFGAEFLRGESLSRLHGSGGQSIMLSLNPLNQAREIDQRTLQDHVAPNAKSDLLYQNALDDTAKSIFAGLIKVEEGAHRTDAYQKVRNLLLSDEAEANSMPGLEILADDVRCTHGATSGDLDPEQIFYLQARGISPKIGRNLIVLGFFNTVLERIEDTELRQKLAELLEKRLRF